MKALLSMKHLREARKRIPFFSSIDLLTVEDDGLAVGVSGKMGYGYRLKGVDYLLRDSAGIQSFLYELKKFMNQVSEDIVLSFHRRSQQGDPELVRAYESLLPQNDPLASAVLEAKKAALGSQQFVKKELFLFVSFLAGEGEKRFWQSRLGKEQNREEVRAILQSSENLILNTFRPLELEITRLSKSEIIRDYFEKLNPTLSKVVPYSEVYKEDPVTYPRFETLRSRLALHPPKASENSFYLDGFHHAVANLRTLPEEATVGMVKRFERSLPDGSEWVLTVRKPDEEKETGTMRVRANVARANAFFRIAEDHLAQERARQYEGFLREMAERGESAF